MKGETLTERHGDWLYLQLEEVRRLGREVSHGIGGELFEKIASAEVAAD